MEAAYLRVHRKSGVKLEGVKPETVLGIIIAATVFASHGYLFTLTSVTDGKEWRSAESLHPFGYAFDCRIWDVPKKKLEPLCAALKNALGPEFDVVLEKDHIHIEFDPR